MEPNVDRGMWAIVALLIAVVIGGAVMLIFPNFIGQIGNEMSDLMTSPSKIIAKGEMPDQPLKYDFLNNEEEWEVGTISNGVYNSRETRIRSKNFVAIEGGKSYEISTNDNYLPLAVAFYGEDKEFIRQTSNFRTNRSVINVLPDIKYAKIVITKDFEEELDPSVILDTGIKLLEVFR